MKKKPKQRPDHPVILVNRKKQTMSLPGNLTLGQLVAMGARDFRIVPKETPLKKGEWTALDSP